MSQKNSVNPKPFYPNSYLLLISKKKLLNSQQKKLSSLTRNCILTAFTSNETVTNLTQYELFQEESDLLKAG